MPVRCMLEGGAKCQQARLSACLPDELYCDRQSERVEARRQSQRATADMVDPAREMSQRRSAFVDRIESRRAAMHGRQEQHLIGRQPPPKALAGFDARGASDGDRARVRHARLFETTLQVRSECARVRLEPRAV